MGNPQPPATRDSFSRLALEARTSITYRVEFLLSPEFQRRLKRICDAICNDFPNDGWRDADDLFQDVQGHLFKKFTFDGLSSFGTWLWRVAKNARISWLRNAASTERAEAGATAQLPSSSAAMFSLRERFARLSPIDREIVKHRAGGASLAVIAERLAMPLSTVGHRLQNAERVLYDAVEPFVNLEMIVGDDRDAD